MGLPAAATKRPVPSPSWTLITRCSKWRVTISSCPSPFTSTSTTCPEPSPTTTGEPGAGLNSGFCEATCVVPHNTTNIIKHRFLYIRFHPSVFIERSHRVLARSASGWQQDSQCAYRRHHCASHRQCHHIKRRYAVQLAGQGFGHGSRSQQSTCDAHRQYQPALPQEQP